MSLTVLETRCSVTNQQDFYDWLEKGYAAGWISDVVCATHHGLPNTPQEEAEWEEGYDPCITAVRIWVEL